MMLIFKNIGCTNYSIEAFVILAQHKYLLSPRERTQLLYSRFINTHGLPGKNISCELHMEHLNRLLKEAIKALGANKTTNAINRLGRCIAPLSDVLDRFDTVHNTEAQKSSHKIPKADKDLITLIKELLKAEVFNNKPGRKHRSFSHFTNNPMSSLDKITCRVIVIIKQLLMFTVITNTANAAQITTHTPLSSGSTCISVKIIK